MLPPCLASRLGLWLKTPGKRPRWGGPSNFNLQEGREGNGREVTEGGKGKERD